MLDTRTSTFLFRLGLGFGALTFGSWLLLGWQWPTIIMLMLAIGPTVEFGNWDGASRMAQLYYGVDEDRIETEAYDPRASLIRSGIASLYCLLLWSLGRGGLDLIPDNAIAIMVILGPIALYLITSALSYRRDIRRAAERLGWSRKLHRRN